MSRGWFRLRRRGAAIASNSLNSLLTPLLGVVVSATVVRRASAEVWGGYVQVLIVLQLAATVVAWGNKEYLLRSFSRQPANMASSWRTGLSSRLPLVAGFGLVVWLFDWPPIVTLVAIVWLLALMIDQSFDVLIVYRRAFLLAFGIELAAVGVTLAYVWQRGSDTTSTDLVLVSTGVSAAAAMALAAFLGRDVWGSGLSWLWRSLDLAYLREAFPFFLLAFSGLLQSRIDLYTVSHFMTPVDVAQYQTFTNLLLYVQALANFILLPFVKSLYRLDARATQRISVRLLAAGLVIVVPAMAGIYLLVTNVYQFTLPAGFYLLGALNVLPIYFYLPIIYALYRHERQTMVLAVNLTGFAASFLLNVLLVPILGLMGALLASTFVRWLVLCFYSLQGRRLNQRSHAGVTGI